ncbi:MAG TPA: DUF3662 and FHA domain-containing protein [Actinomycetota bacterium]|nr:DUF3662 and FHA domain-containing protein [Actinomycetota bacterium]
MGLQQFEQRLERLVEGAFAKAFRSGLQPVEIARRLTREMDLQRSVGPRGVIAPNAFEVGLAPADIDRFESFADALSRELADAAREHARTERYNFMGPVEVALKPNQSVSPGACRVTSEVKGGPGGGPTIGLVLPDGRTVTMADRPLVIGRLPECDIVVEDSNVSRRHAEVRRDGPDVVVVDLGSTNGTRVNGARVQTRRLNDGDEITIGRTSIRFEVR